MNVMETGAKGEAFCFEDIMVYWGVYHDTLAIHYQGLSLHFYSVTKQTWKDSKVSYKKINNGLVKLNEHHKDRLHYVLQDQYNDKYFIMISQTPTAMIMGISNLDAKYPSYMFCYGCSKFCN